MADRPGLSRDLNYISGSLFIVTGPVCDMLSEAVPKSAKGPMNRLMHRKSEVLFDDSVGKHKKARSNCETEGPRRPQVNH